VNLPCFGVKLDVLWEFSLATPGKKHLGSLAWPWIIRLSGLAFVLILIFSLVSFNPTDPSFFNTTNRIEIIHNLCGKLGSYLASLFYTIFGIMAWLIPGWILWEIWPDTSDAPRWARRLAWLGLIASLSVMWAFAPQVFSFRMGGLLGAVLQPWLQSWFGTTGLYVLCLALLAISLLIVSPALATWIGSRLATWAERYWWPKLQALPMTGLRNLWGHWISVFNFLRRKREEAKIRKNTLSQISFDEQREALERAQKAHDESRNSLAPPSPRDVLPEIHSINLDAPASNALTDFRSDLLQGVTTPPEEPYLEEALTGKDGQGRPIVQPPLPIPPLPDPPKIKKEVKKSTNRSLPSKDLFDQPLKSEKMDLSVIKSTQEAILQKLLEFKISGQVIGNRPGPIVTVYEFQPDPGIPLSKILNMEEDLAMALQAEAIRMDRISGKNAVGIEVPNPRRDLIVFREIIESDAFQQSKSLLTMALGKDISGSPLVMDLARMPHLLIGGSTGSGKSVAVNAMICSILLRATSEQVKLILIDPKMVEMGIYEDIPHLWSPVVTDMKEAGRVLRWVVAQMEERYKRLALLSVRNLEQYNEKIEKNGGTFTLPDPTPTPKWPDRPATLEPIPYVVVVIDELADLIMVARTEVEDSIARIAQKARAVGIHLILATQRPSVDILTGVIKANLPSRLSYRVSTKIDSRTILDCSGAENLLGQGDGLFLAPGAARPSRIHAPYLTETETLRLVDWLKDRGRPDYNEQLIKVIETDESEEAMDIGPNSGSGGDIYQKAIEVVIREGKASTSLLQRKLGLGYGRAARIIDRMENEGVIGPDRGVGKPREIFRQP
jgi:S-DNA-T family DNA segregation ATPase FtsK/SpoIIIE